MLPCIPRLVGKAAQEDGAEAGGRGDPPALGSPLVRPSEGPWVGSSERVKDAQGNTGLSCLEGPSSALQWAGV